MNTQRLFEIQLFSEIKYNILKSVDSTADRVIGKYFQIINTVFNFFFSVIVTQYRQNTESVYSESVKCKVQCAHSNQAIMILIIARNRSQKIGSPSKNLAIFSTL